MYIDPVLFKILACPFHRNHTLHFSVKSVAFFCDSCNNSYELLEQDGVYIPNFLIDKGNWDRGFRGIKSNIVNSFQGKPFKRQLEENKLVLDVGCGENARGNINMDCYIPGKLPRNFILANAEYLPFKPNSIDIILSYYNIEHLINPAAHIMSLYETVKNKVEIVTDNSEWLGDMIFRVIGDGRIFHDEHYYKWSIEYFANLLSRLGLKKNSVCLLNRSSNPIVSSLSKLGSLPIIGNFFYRDLKAEIHKD